MTTNATMNSTGLPEEQNAQSIMTFATANNSQTSKPAAVKASETFNGTWPFKAHYSKAPGFAMHYVDEGKGETMLFLHGEPTWGYLYRHQIAALKDKYRVVVPDHMGFGKSETPDTRTYFLQDHIDNLEAFVLDLDLTPYCKPPAKPVAYNMELSGFEIAYKSKERFPKEPGNWAYLPSGIMLRPMRPLRRPSLLQLALPATKHPPQKIWFSPNTIPC